MDCGRRCSSSLLVVHPHKADENNDQEDPNGEPEEPQRHEETRPKFGERGEGHPPREENCWS